MRTNRGRSIIPPPPPPADLSNRCMDSASVLLSSSMMRLGACRLPYWSWNGWPWLWWRPEKAASWEGSRPPWCSGAPWRGPHFWERAQRGTGDGDGEPEESSPPGGTQIITFLGGRGGECFPPGMQGNFMGWQESRQKNREGQDGMKDGMKDGWTFEPAPRRSER